ncbi:MAG: 2-oxo-tetronate isomerase [Limnobaculum xujianqingii]
MLKFAANLTMMFNEVSFPERFELAARAGFQGVEFLFPYQYDVTELKTQLKHHQLTQVLFNAPPGNWLAGERGLASLPNRESEFRQSLELVIEYAIQLECHQIHIMAGNRQTELSEGEQQQQLIRQLTYAADKLSDYGINILIEPINPFDMPDYFLKYISQAENIIREVNRPNISIQFDIYHCQKTQGNILHNLNHYFKNIGHIQIASVPYRNEPGLGEINYPWLFSQIEKLNYRGWIGCEYHPAGNTTEGLFWLNKVNHNLSIAY